MDNHTTHNTSDYYIIAVSQHLIRLIEVNRGQSAREIKTGDFPFKTNSFYQVSWNKPAADGFGDHMEREFYNDADKSFREIYNTKPLPVVLAGTVKSAAYYQEQMDDSRMVIAHVHGNFDHNPPEYIMDVVEPEVKKYRQSLAPMETW